MSKRGIGVSATGLTLTGAAAATTRSPRPPSPRRRHHHPEDVDGDADRYGEQGLRRHDHRQPRRVELQLLLRGVIGSDAVTVSPTSGTYASANVGTGITVTAAGLSLSGTAAGNYKLAATSLSGAIGTNTPKTLTATLTGTVSKVYDGTTTATSPGRTSTSPPAG